MGEENKERPLRCRHFKMSGADYFTSRESKATPLGDICEDVVEIYGSSNEKVPESPPQTPYYMANGKSISRIITHTKYQNAQFVFILR